MKEGKKEEWKERNEKKERDERKKGKKRKKDSLKKVERKQYQWTDQSLSSYKISIKQMI